ncbi:MAG TPA: phosphatase PAP2 family protein, partial [Gammaproteobacteria bacterium]|nr:phosphatase PAP2 family protein [Gammaproteobacteria bacterium]
MDAAALVETVSHWIATHPGWAGWLVFAIALGESLAVVGLFVPGAVLMFVIGALVGGGMMELWSTLAWAAAGAVAGDGISYWLGRYYHQRLRQVWPFSRYPALIDKGEAFFQRHGGKGVLFGRFVGPVRPIIPVVAGMMDMPAWRFSLINVLSALLWAPAYILPGVVFSSSLSMATEVAGRLAVVMLLLFTVLLVTVWLMRRIFWLLQPRANPVISRILLWSRRHPLVGGVAEALLDPEHPEARGLAILSVVLFVAVVVSVLLVTAIQESQLLGNLDLLIFNALQALRTPWADQVMVFVTWFGDMYAIGLLLLVAVGWLGWKGNWRAVSHLVAAAVCTEIMVLVLKAVTAIDRPVAIYHGVNTFSFPSGHTAMSTVVYGMLAIIVAGMLPVARRWLAYGLAGVLAVLVGFSRLYLGAHWFSDVLGGFLLGVAWAALVGIAYRRHPPAVQRVTAGRFSVVIAAALVVTALWGAAQVGREVDRYAPVRTVERLGMEQWWQEGWAELPAYRADFRSLHNHPLTVQWDGSIADLRDYLGEVGWYVPPSLDITHALRLLASQTDVGELPVLPQVNDGRHEALRLVHTTGRSDRLLVLRLWPTDVVLVPGDVPLWQGNVTWLRFSRVAGLVTRVSTETDFIQPLNVFFRDIERIKGLSVKRVFRNGELPKTVA